MNLVDEERTVAGQLNAAIRSIDPDDPDFRIVEGVDLMVKVSLDAAETQTVLYLMGRADTLGQGERQRVCSEWVSNWLSPAVAPRLQEMSEYLALMRARG